MALADDIGLEAQPANKSSLAADIGLSSSAPEQQVSAHPVTDELSNIVSNIAKQTPRHLMRGIGQLADLPGRVWDMAFHPGEDEDADIGTGVATKVANKLEQVAPSLKPKNEGGIER